MGNEDHLIICAEWTKKKLIEPLKMKELWMLLKQSLHFFVSCEVNGIAADYRYTDVFPSA